MDDAADQNYEEVGDEMYEEVNENIDLDIEFMPIPTDSLVMEKLRKQSQTVVSTSRQSSPLPSLPPLPPPPPPAEVGDRDGTISIPDDIYSELQQAYEEINDLAYEEPILENAPALTQHSHGSSKHLQPPDEAVKQNLSFLPLKQSTTTAKSSCQQLGNVELAADLGIPSLLNAPSGLLTTDMNSSTSTPLPATKIMQKRSVEQQQQVSGPIKVLKKVKVKRKKISQSQSSVAASEVSSIPSIISSSLRPKSYLPEPHMPEPHVPEYTRFSQPEPSIPATQSRIPSITDCMSVSSEMYNRTYSWLQPSEDESYIRPSLIKPFYERRMRRPKRMGKSDAAWADAASCYTTWCYDVSTQTALSGPDRKLRAFLYKTLLPKKNKNRRKRRISRTSFVIRPEHLAEHEGGEDSLIDSEPITLVMEKGTDADDNGEFETVLRIPRNVDREDLTVGTQLSDDDSKNVIKTRALPNRPKLMSSRDVGISIGSVLDSSGNSVYVRLTEDWYQTTLEFGQVALLTVPPFPIEECGAMAATNLQSALGTLTRYNLVIPIQIHRDYKGVIQVLHQKDIQPETHFCKGKKILPKRYKHTLNITMITQLHQVGWVWISRNTRRAKMSFVNVKLCAAIYASDRTVYIGK